MCRARAERLRQVCERFGVSRLEVFGSVGRGDAIAESYVDVLYDLVPGTRLGWDIEDLAWSLPLLFSGAGRQFPSGGGRAAPESVLAAAQFDEAVTEGFPAVKWARPSQLRNRIVRGYWSIDLPILHTTATDQLPGFTQQLREVPARLRAEEA